MSLNARQIVKKAAITFTLLSVIGSLFLFSTILFYEAITTGANFLQWIAIIFISLSNSVFCFSAIELYKESKGMLFQ